MEGGRASAGLENGDCGRAVDGETTQLTLLIPPGPLPTPRFNSSCVIVVDTVLGSGCDGMQFSSRPFLGSFMYWSRVQ